MMRALAGALCFVLFASTAAGAQPRGGNRGGPPQRGAPVQHAAPAQRGGFQLSRDLAAPPRPAPPRPAPQHVAAPRPAPQRNGVQIAIRTNPQRQIAAFAGRRRINNPAFRGNAWGWNHGVAWNPAPAYWGGGFWGALAFTAAAALFGEIAYAGQTYTSYQVYPDSPGAQLLANYQLTQTPCGPPNLVVIWGPDNSLICAFPNNVVGPGEYDVDPTTLTLVSESS
jgi:hypothetical protein